MRYYLVSWDCMGVECLRDVTEFHPDVWAQQHLFNSIKTAERPPDITLGHDVAMMRLRARLNPQRNYEIYLFTTEDSIDIIDLDNWIKQDIQGFADWVRDNYAKCLWSDRATKKPAIV
jgi:hypothetical protein